MSRDDKVRVFDGQQYIVIVPRKVIVVLSNMKPALRRESNADTIH